ncbi:hypothetical protein CKW48_21800, partial [Bordetella pertussis]
AAAIDKRSDGLSVRLEAQAEAFAALKAEGTLTANLLRRRSTSAATASACAWRPRPRPSRP